MPRLYIGRTYLSQSVVANPLWKLPRNMYRLLLLCLLIHSNLAHGGWGHGHRHGHGHGHNHHHHPPPDGDFGKLARDVIALDQALQRNCSSNGNRLAETYLINNYQLAVALPEFAVENIKVKIMHSVLYVEAVKAGRTFSEVKWLPDVVDPASVRWMFNEGRLLIEMNYRVALGKEFVKACDAAINSTVSEVPMGLGLEERFGDENDTQATPLKVAKNVV